MKSATLTVLFLSLISGCDQFSGNSATSTVPLAEARQGFQTKLTRQVAQGEPADVPPAKLFRLVHYASPAGQLVAYVSPPPASSAAPAGEQAKYPAIIWITGGFSNSIGSEAWTSFPASNDQSASAFREAGLVMMYPSLRGGNDNPGYLEVCFGEVDDVLAAAQYLSTLDYVDPQRIYLGGHSTGGTLALLTAEYGGPFRAVFAFGPVADVAGYGSGELTFDLTNRRELELRAPGRWLASIKVPTFVLEGAQGGSNIASVQAMARRNQNPFVRFYSVRGADHFSILAPATRLLARKILADTGPVTNMALSEDEINSLMGR